MLPSPQQRSHSQPTPGYSPHTAHHPWATHLQRRLAVLQHDGRVLHAVLRGKEETVPQQSAKRQAAFKGKIALDSCCAAELLYHASCEQPRRAPQPHNCCDMPAMGNPGVHLSRTAAVPCQPAQASIQPLTTSFRSGLLAAVHVSQLSWPFCMFMEFARMHLQECRPEQGRGRRERQTSPRKNSMGGRNCIQRRVLTG